MSHTRSPVAPVPNTCTVLGHGNNDAAPTGSWLPCDKMTGMSSSRQSPKLAVNIVLHAHWRIRLIEQIPRDDDRIYALVDSVVDNPLQHGSSREAKLFKSTVRQLRSPKLKRRPDMKICRMQDAKHLVLPFETKHTFGSIMTDSTPIAKFLALWHAQKFGRAHIWV